MDDDVWVGCWRPHKPRGPIAALYSGPGPKYMLPGATGVSDHDPRKLKAPAYSFGTRHAQVKKSFSPGPGYLVPYNLTRTGHGGSPAYSLYSRPKDPHRFQTPGPGTYQPENATKAAFHSSPSYSLSARTNLARRDQTPGPAEYMLPPEVGPKSVCKRSAPNISISGRHKLGSFHEDLRKTPGPGTYKAVDPNLYKSKSPQYSLYGLHKLPGDATQKPGPGAHYPENVTFTKSTAPSFTFGIRHIEQGMSDLDVWVGPWRPHKPRGPTNTLYGGPGPKYMLPGATGVSDHDPRKLKAPAYSFGTRHAQVKKSFSPGPGYLVPYNLTRTGHGGSPAYSLYSRPKDPQRFQTPGPGTYQPENATKAAFHSSPSYSLSARTNLARRDQTPGPAEYMLPPEVGLKSVCKRSAPNISISGRHKLGSFHEDLRKTPGPGTYKAVDPNLYKSKSPQYSLYGLHKLPGDATQKPGPGAHYPENVTATKSKAPGYTFGIHHSQYVAPLILPIDTTTK